MRRKDREITDAAKIESIIARSRYMHLGMFDGDFPYVVPMHYGYEMSGGKLRFYMHCAKDGHKIDCLRTNGNVFIEIDRGEMLITSDVPCRCSAGYECVMCRGKAVIVEETDEKCRALKAIMRVQTGEEYEINEKMADAVSIIRVDVESYTAKAHV